MTITAAEMRKYTNTKAERETTALVERVIGKIADAACNGDSTLTLTSVTGFNPLVKQLRELGYNVFYPNYDGCNPLDETAKDWKPRDITINW